LKYLSKIINKADVKLLLLSVIVFFGSCTGSRLHTGEYTIERRGYVEKLKLDSAGQFQYSLFVGLSKRKSFGRWQYIKHRIYITSDTSLAKRNGTAEERKLGDRSDNVKLIKLVDSLVNAPVQGLGFTINDGVRVESDSNGLVYFPGIIHYIHIEYFKRYQFFYSIRNPESDYIEIRLAPINSSEVYFNRERVVVRNRKVKFNNSIYKLSGK